MKLSTFIIKATDQKTVGVLRVEHFKSRRRERVRGPAAVCKRGRSHPVFNRDQWHGTSMRMLFRFILLRYSLEVHERLLG